MSQVTMNSVFSIMHGAGLWVEVTDERSKVLRLDGETEKMRAECDHLWKELQAQAKVSVDSLTTLAKCGQELDVA